MHVIEHLLDRREIEAQGFLDCRNVLDGVGKNDKQRLEAACQHALNAEIAPSFTTLKRLMASIDTDAKRPGVPRPAGSNRKPGFEPVHEHEGHTAQAPDGAHIRGADYYRGLEQNRGV